MTPTHGTRDIFLGSSVQSVEQKNRHFRDRVRRYTHSYNTVVVYFPFPSGIFVTTGSIIIISSIDSVVPFVKLVYTTSTVAVKKASLALLHKQLFSVSFSLKKKEEEIYRQQDVSNYFVGWDGM